MANAPVVWRSEAGGTIGGHHPEVLGAPRIGREEGRGHVQFDGKADGWVVPVNPLAGWPSFTVELLFRPAVEGEFEQKVVHVEDTAGRRLMFETRLEGGKWSLDTFLTTGTSSGMLLDRALSHPAGQWHWAAMVYDQGRMTSFVNGRQELSTTVDFTPMVSGRTGLGVRLNRVFWYRGDIGELRFHPRALPVDELARA